MKRKLLTLFIAILLVVTLCLTIVACGEKDDTPNNDQIEAPSGDNSDTDAPSGEQPGGDVVPPQEPEEELPSDEITPPQEPEDNTYSLKFELKEDDTYEVIGHNGEPTNVVIPSTYQGKAVTSIGNVAFANCALLTSVTIGNNITSIGYYAFEGCKALNIVNISSIESWCGITFGGYFANPLSNGAKLYLNGEEVTNLVIPDTVTEIKDYVFSGCTSITSVSIPNTVTRIGSSAFSGCSSLDSVYYLGTIESWCGITFDGFSSNPLSNGAKLYLNGEEVTNLVIPDTVTEIKARAFDGCTSLTSVTIPNSVISIGNYAFFSCDLLSSVVIPDSVTSIGDYAFYNCYKLVEVYNLSSLNITAGSSSNGDVGYYAKDIYTSLNTPSKLSTDENGYIIYTDGQTKSLVGYVGDETELTLPSGITEINQYAFRYCDSLTSVVIPDSVTSIGKQAFEYCYRLIEVYNLSSLDIQKGSEDYGNVGYYALDVYTSLETQSKLSTDSNGYIIHTNGEEKTLVGYVGDETELTLPRGITLIYLFAFYENRTITSVVIPDSVTSIGDYAFTYCTALTNVTIPNSVEIIGDYAFTYCTALTNVTIPNSVTSIGEWAFFNCTSLTSVTIPNSVTSIGYEAFRGCISLTSVIIGNSLESIGNYAFAGCDSLTSVTIGNSVTSIGNYAFEDCTSLTSVNYLGTIESWCRISFGNYDANPLYYANKLYLNGELLTADLVILDNVTEIKNYAFYGCTSLTNVTIGNSVTSIGEFAFSDCTSLTSVVIGNSVTSIGWSAFSDCTSLISVTIGNSVTSIGNYAFYSCYKLVEVYNLSSLNIEKGYSSYGNVGYYAKDIYTSLNTPSKLNTDENGYIIYTDGQTKSLVGYVGDETELTLPSGITEINQYAFSDCNSLTSVVIGNSVTSIGYDAFRNCESLTIYCEAESKPSGWDSNWNYSGRPVVWGVSEVTLVDGIIYGLKDTSAKVIGYDGTPTAVIIPSTITYNETSYNVTSIYSHAFRLCTSLTSITIPSSVTSIGERAFDYCYKLVEVYNLSNLTIEKRSASNGCVGAHALDVYTSLDTPSKLSTDSNGYIIYTDGEEKILVGYVGDETELTLPSGITLIYLFAFYKNRTITSVVIPDTVTIIGSSAFLSCYSLSSVNYLGTIEQWCGITFGDYSANPLYYANKLYLNGELLTADLVIPDTVTEIKARAFYNCDLLTSIVISDNVTSIGSYAFSSCDSLSRVYYAGTVEEWSVISIESGNSNLTVATRYYYSETEPVEEGNYWHYVGGVPTPW